MRRLAPLAFVLLAACGSNPPPPDWALNSQGALERAGSAWLSGNTRVGEVEFARARTEIARTGQPERLARAELLRCAWAVASLEMTDCPAYQSLVADAAPAEQAYARYLLGKPQAGDVALLPEPQRPVAQALLAGATATLPNTPDPLAKLVAAGVLLRAGQASPAVVAQAVDTASAQGWSRPLLAWLQVQARVAEQAGDRAGAERARRRAALVGGVRP